jgi:hypothetical protein
MAFMAFIPAKHAGKKGYSRLLFYFYGLVLFIPALIHSVVIKDVADERERRYSTTAITLAVLTSFTFEIQLLGGAFSIISMPEFTWAELISMLISGIVAILYYASIIATRNYEFKRLVFISLIVQQIIGLFGKAAAVFGFASVTEDKYMMQSYMVYMYAYIVIIYLGYSIVIGMIISIVRMVGMKNDRSAADNKALFMIPIAILLGLMIYDLVALVPYGIPVELGFNFLNKVFFPVSLILYILFLHEDAKGLEGQVNANLC